MQENKFDKKIRELLDSLHEDYDSSSWASLSEKMDELDKAPIDSEDSIIPTVKEKLEDQRAEVNQEHWESLKSDLDYIQERKERLYVIKMLEAAVVLLLILTYFNYKWHAKDIQIDTEYFAELESEMIQPEFISAAITPVNRTLRNSAIVNRRKNIDQLTSLPPITVGEITSNNAMYIVSPKILSSDEEVFDQDSETLIPEIPDGTLNELYVTHKAPNLPLLELYEAEAGIDDSYMKGWSFALPFSYDVNFINTDINLGYLSNQIRSGLAGTSIGLSVSYRKNYFELESGFKYSQKTFVPGLLTNYSKAGVNSYIESQLNDMNIHQIQVPLIAKFHAMPYKSSSLYGIVGFAVNGITSNSYNISRTVQSKAILESSPLTQVIDLKRLPQGIADGGSFSQNIYLTSIIGFGIQSHIANGVSWYFQPQYQHSFTSEINELITKINTLSVEGGVRFAF